MKMNALYTTALVSIMALGTVGMPQIAFAQTEQTEQTETASADDSLRASLSEMKENRESRVAQLEAIEQQMAVIAKSVEETERVYDEMIEGERQQAELGNPEGKFVQAIQQQAAFARSRAEDWLVKGNPTLAKNFTERAEKLEEGALTLEQYWLSSSSRIANINLKKEEMIAYIELNLLDDSIRVMNEGIGVVKATDERLKKIEDDLGVLVGSGQSE